jgi:hypothetical protein
MTLTRKKGNGIRIGDRVRVVNPEFFVRCGYPMVFQYEAKRVVRDRRESIESFLRSHDIEPYRLDSLGLHPAVTKIAKVLAYELCKAKKWGGRERKIYTHRFDLYAGQDFSVASVRFVKTGEYISGECYGTYGGYEYEPAYLSNEKTHRILKLNIFDLIPGQDWHNPLEIESANVELLSSGDCDGQEAT